MEGTGVAEWQPPRGRGQVARFSHTHVQQAAIRSLKHGELPRLQGGGTLEKGSSLGD